MSKVKYDGITFDSEWEKEYYICLRDDLKANRIIYHPKPITDLMARKQYTPDFIYIKDNIVSVVEVKGNYNPFANHFQDDMIHKEMKQRSSIWLMQYCAENGIIPLPSYYTYQYEKVKKLKQGWVDYEWKNPNTIANKRKEKINDLSLEIKDLRDFKKKVVRFIGYQIKIENKGKLTKQQQAWYDAYKEELKQIVEGEKE